MMMVNAAFIRRGTGFLLLFFFCSIHAFSQKVGFSDEIKFIRYLQDKELFREAQFEIKNIDTSRLSPVQKDSLFYLSGWSAYNFKQLDVAVDQLLRVSASFPLYKKSRFFAGYCLAYLGKQDAAMNIITSLPLPDSIDMEVQQFQLAGMALLRRDYRAFNQYQRRFSYSSYALEKEEKNMGKYDSSMKSYKHKSPVVAGIYSAILPGAGKFYAGKKRQGIAAFLPVLSLGAITYEAYRKGGVKSARFITFGSLFSVFYIGNIWGSVLSVRIKQQEFYRAYDNQILFDLHIPLRSLYN